MTYSNKHQVKVTLNDEEYNILKAESSRYNMSMSAYIKKNLLNTSELKSINWKLDNLTNMIKNGRWNS